MIKTVTQLKAKVGNISYGDSQKAKTLFRIFIMERFLKGDIFVAAVVGLDTRTTMDIDTT